MNGKQSYAWGVLCSFLCAFIWGSSHISGRWLMSSRYIDVISLCSIRYSLGGLILLGVGLMFYRSKILSVTLRDLLTLSGLGFLGMVIHTTLLLIGQGYTTAINTSLILSLNPIIVMFITLFFGHRIKGTQAFGMTLSLLGCLMVIGVISSCGFNYNSANSYGDVITLAAATFWALYVVLSVKIVIRLGGFTVTTWTMLSGALQFLLLRLFWPVETYIPSSLETVQWLVILYVIFFPTAIGFYFWNEAMSRIKLSLLNIMQYLMPVSTILLSYLVLGEKMTLFNIAGAILTLFGIMIASETIRLPKFTIFEFSCSKTETKIN